MVILAVLYALLPCGIVAQTVNPELEVDVRGVPSGGYLVAAPLSPDSFGLVDLSGRLVFRRGVGFHTNLQVHGTNRVSVFTGNFGFFNYVLFDSLFVPIDTVIVTPPYVTDSHEGMLWSDSTFMMLGIDFRPFDMSAVIGGGQTNANLMATVLQERHLTTDSVLFEWNAFDRIPVTDATPNIDLRQRVIDYIHANSIARDLDGDLIVSCRHLDEVIKIRRSDGTIVWRLGGVASKNKQFAFINDDHDSVQGFSHQHTAVRTNRGTLMLFDNGNLKPLQRSRVVEYALDTVAMTATRVWSYTPNPPLYSPSQGSVQELPNGNILIGYSSTNDQRVAEEIDRNGTIVMQLRRLSLAPLQPYRVYQTTFGCTSIEKMIDGSGFHWYRSPDSATGIALEVNAVNPPMRSRAELHHYRPHSFSTSDSGVCGPLSRRWMFYYDSSSTVTGGMRFEVSEFSMPQQLQLYHRPREGYGDFRRVETTYDAMLKTMATSKVFAGEFALAYPYCVEPVPLFPSTGAMNVPSTTRVRWSESPDATSYDLQVALNPGMSAPFLDVTTTSRDTVLTSLPVSTQVYWRIRKRSSDAVGAWSDASTFTTAGMVGVHFDSRTEYSEVHVRALDGRLFVVGADRATTVQVYDLLGSLVASGSVEAMSGMVRDINLSGFPPIVVVRVSSPHEVCHQQVILVAR